MSAKRGYSTHWKKQQLLKATCGIKSAAGWTTPTKRTGQPNDESLKENSEDDYLVKPSVGSTLKRKRHEEEENEEASSSFAAMAVLTERNEVERINNTNRDIIQPVSLKSYVDDHDDLGSKSPVSKKRRQNKKKVHNNGGEDNSSSNNDYGLLSISKLSAKIDTEPKGEVGNQDIVLQKNSKNRTRPQQQRSMTVTDKRQSLSRVAKTASPTEPVHIPRAVLQNNSRNNHNKRPRQGRGRAATFLVRLPHDDPSRLNVDENFTQQNDDPIPFQEIDEDVQVQTNRSCITSIPFLTGNDLKEFVTTFYKGEIKNGRKKPRRRKQSNNRHKKSQKSNYFGNYWNSPSGTSF